MSGKVTGRRGCGKQQRRSRAVYGRAADLRVRRELEGVFGEFMGAAETDEREFLLAVLTDYLEMRGDERDWLECLQTAFNQNLGDETRLLRVKPDQVGEVLLYLRWLEGREAEEREAVQTCG